MTLVNVADTFCPLVLFLIYTKRNKVKSILLLLLLSCFSRVRLCATPWTAAYQAPPFMGFSRQEYWSGLPLPSPTGLESKLNNMMVKYSHRWSALFVINVIIMNKCYLSSRLSIYNYCYVAAAKSLQSCPTLCDPIDSSPPGFSVPGVLQARTLELGCHFLLQWMKVKSESEVVQSCLTPSDPIVCSAPGPSIHGIFQVRVLEWVAIAFSAWYVAVLLDWLKDLAS